MRPTQFLLLGALVALSPFVAAQTPFRPDTVVVARGDAHVTLRDVDEYMQRVPADKRAGMMDSPKRIEAMLLSMLLNEQLTQQAVQMKLDRDPEAHGKTGWERVEVLSRLRMQKFMQDLKVPDLEQLAREEYLAHKSSYGTHGAWTVQRVFVATKEPRKKESEKAAWDRAVEARGKAVAAPDKFDDVVAEYSDAPDKGTTHGMITDVQNARPDRWLLEGLSALHEPGDISEVLAANGGYQFVKLVSKAPDTVPPFAEVHDRILTKLKADYIDAQRRDFLDNLAGEKMTANPEAVASLRIRYDTPVAPPPGDAAPASGGRSSTGR